MRIITFKANEEAIALIDNLVKMGRYNSRSEFIRKAIDLLLALEYNRLQEDDPSQHRSTDYTSANASNECSEVDPL